jgi:hypothetical protein
MSRFCFLRFPGLFSIYSKQGILRPFPTPFTQKGISPEWGKIKPELLVQKYIISAQSNPCGTKIKK